MKVRQFSSIFVALAPPKLNQGSRLKSDREMVDPTGKLSLFLLLLFQAT